MTAAADRPSPPDLQEWRLRRVLEHHMGRMGRRAFLSGPIDTSNQPKRRPQEKW
jgi:hypothetical protein